MENNRLKVVLNHSMEEKSAVSNRKMQRLETQAKFDRLWLIDPKQMDPLRNCMERERVKRTLALIQKTLSLEGKAIVDLGCGSGVISRKLRDAGGNIDAVDISINALSLLKKEPIDNIQARQDFVPMTTLKDDAYDLVVSTELIALLPQDEYRLYFSELARLVKLEGYVVCSTLIDINSEDALQRFANLAETEFKIDHWVFSYHLCYLKIANFFKAPSRFVRALKDPEYRSRELKRRYGFNQWWFKINSAKPLAYSWYLFYYLLIPVVGMIRQNETLLLFLEKICTFLWNQSGISHAIFIGQRRPMVQVLPKNEIPRELKHKRQLWE